MFLGVIVYVHWHYHGFFTNWMPGRESSNYTSKVYSIGDIDIKKRCIHMYISTVCFMYCSISCFIAIQSIPCWIARSGPGAWLQHLHSCHVMHGFQCIGCIPVFCNQCFPIYGSTFLMVFLMVSWKSWYFLVGGDLTYQLFKEQTFSNVKLLPAQSHIEALWYVPKSPSCLVVASTSMPLGSWAGDVMSGRYLEAVSMDDPAVTWAAKNETNRLLIYPFVGN